MLDLWDGAAQLDPADFWTHIERTRLAQTLGDLPRARQAAEQARTAAKTPRDQSVALNDFGDIAVAQGDLAGAARVYQESLDIRRRLSAANPSSAALARDVGVSLAKLAGLPNSGVTWRQVAEHFQVMKDKGILAPTDERWLEQFKRCAEELEGAR